MICECCCLGTNYVYTSKGKPSISFFDIHAFIGLLLYGPLYVEAVSPAKDLKTSLRWSCTNLFIAYHILQGKVVHKPTIEERIAFGFCRSSKCQAPTRPNERDRVPHLSNTPFFMNRMTHRRDDSHAQNYQITQKNNSSRLQSLTSIKCSRPNHAKQPKICVRNKPLKGAIFLYTCSLGVVRGYASSLQRHRSRQSLVQCPSCFTLKHISKYLCVILYMLA